jgi:peptide subunit release factor RF-3
MIAFSGFPNKPPTYYKIKNRKKCCFTADLQKGYHLLNNETAIFILQPYNQPNQIRYDVFKIRYDLL